MSKTQGRALNDSERLEAIGEVLERLRELSRDHILVVEGKKDTAALAAVGIVGETFQVQSQGGPVNASEYVEDHGGKAVVLTDWDRRGDTLAEQLSQILGKDNPNIDFQIRRELSALCRPYTKDIESIDSLVEMLSAKIYVQ